MGGPFGKGAKDVGIPAATERPPEDAPVVRPRLSATLRSLAEIGRRPGVTLGDLVSERHGPPHPLATLLLGLPFLVPVPLPGLSTLFGALIVLAGTRMALGLDAPVPARWRAMKVPGPALARVLDVAARVAERLESRMRPRGTGWSDHPATRRAAGALIAACGLLLLLPLPPGTNWPPAGAAVLLSLGVLVGDGLVLALGGVAVAANAVFFTALARLGSGAFASLAALFG